MQYVIWKFRKSGSGMYSRHEDTFNFKKNIFLKIRIMQLWRYSLFSSFGKGVSSIPVDMLCSLLPFSMGDREILSRHCSGKERKERRRIKGEMGHKFLFSFFGGNEWMHQKKTFLLPDFLLLPDNKHTQGLDYGGGGKPVKSLIRTVPQTLLEILVTSVGPPPIPFFCLRRWRDPPPT